MTTEPRERAHDDSTMQRLLLESEDITAFLTAFTAMLADRITSPGIERWCAVSLLRDRKAATAASSNPQADALDEMQNRFTDGPCMTAIRENTVVRTGDLRTDTRWPDYRAAATAQGVRSVLGLPFDLSPEARAGLNLYSGVPHDFDASMIELIRHEVDQASSALRLAVRLAHHRESQRDVQAAMVSRTAIDLAVGIVMGQNRCSQDDAVTILKAASNHRNVKLRDLAAELVASVDASPVQTSFERGEHDIVDPR